MAFFLNTILFQNCAKYQSSIMNSSSDSSFSSTDGSGTVTPPNGSGTKTCTVGAVQVLHGQSQNFYSNSSSTNCDSIKQLRSCNNGVMSGSDSFSISSCSALPNYVEPPVSDAQTTCEEVANPHTSANAVKYGQHTYYDSKNKRILGTIKALYRPQYKIDGINDWKNMDYVGDTTDGSGLKAWMFKQPTDGNPRTTSYRTRAGCTEYPDTRPQPQWNTTENRIFRTDTLETYYAPTGLPALDYANLTNDEVPIWFSSEMEDGLDNANYNVTSWEGRFYNLNVAQFRILTPNNYGHNDWMNLETYGSYKRTTSFFFTLKDFAFEIKLNSGKIQRYQVTRSYAGGHYSVRSVITRFDGVVYYIPQSLMSESINMRMKNLTTGAVTTNIRQNGLGHIYRLDPIADGDYTIRIYSEGKEYSTVDDTIIKVRRPQ